MQEEISKNEVRHHSELNRAKSEAEKFKSLISEAESSRDEYKEELDTLQVSVMFMTTTLNEKKLHMTELEEKLERMDKWQQ